MPVQNIIDGHTLHTLQIYIYVGIPLSSFALGKYLNIKNFFFFFFKDMPDQREGLSIPILDFFKWFFQEGTH